jgi:hypothetical protein
MREVAFENRSGGPPNTKDDPGADQLRWLALQLKDAVAKEDKVWLLYHIPYGIEMTDRTWPLYWCAIDYLTAASFQIGVENFSRP